MARIVLVVGGKRYCLAALNESQTDGSIYLQLLRVGVSTQRWVNADGGRASLQTFDAGIPKTKMISLHTSGRINYRMTSSKGVGDSVIFVHCLLDTRLPELIIAYRIPSIFKLDECDVEADDMLVQVNDYNEQPLCFVFELIKATEPSVLGELCRYTLHATYGIRCLLVDVGSFPQLQGVPKAAFSTWHPVLRLHRQQLDRQSSFIRFKRLQHGLGEDGGIVGPNKQGVYEAICAVPMRAVPNLLVEFDDARKYFAELVDISPAYQCVMVKFKVRLRKGRAVAKHYVGIKRVMLDAEL